MNHLIKTCYRRYFESGHIRLYVDGQGKTWLTNILSGNIYIKPGPNYEQTKACNGWLKYGERNEL